MQPALNPVELAAMSNRDVETFRRLQVTFKYLVDNKTPLRNLHDHWINNMNSMQPAILSAATENPLNWSIQKVADFVAALPNCDGIADLFIEHEIDGTSFLLLQQNDLIDKMGLSLGHALKVFNCILELRAKTNAHYIRYE